MARVLGPVAFDIEGTPVRLGSPVQRCVFALLVAHSPAPVRIDQFAEGLWDGDEVRARPNVQVYVSNLRKCLRPGNAGVGIETVPGGYRLIAETDQVDWRRFDVLLTSALEELTLGQAQVALSSLRAAMDLWRGDCCAEFPDVQSLQARAVYLNERRIVAEEALCEAQIVLGDSTLAIAGLEGLVATNPLRESLWVHLVDALAASGRRAEALRAFRRARVALAEVGIEPGPVLLFAERRIIEGSAESRRSLDLVRVDARGSYRTFRLDGEEGHRYTIGRSGDCDVVVAENKVSRVHAEVYLRHGRWWILDAASTNGTSVNGDAIHEARPLAPGSLIEVGSVRLAVQTGSLITSMSDTSETTHQVSEAPE